MSKKPASLTSDLLARKGEAEPSTIDPSARMTLSAGSGFPDDEGGGGDERQEPGMGSATDTRPMPPEPEIIYTAEENGSGGGSRRFIIVAVLGLIIVGGIFLAMSGNKKDDVAPVAPNLMDETSVPAQTPGQQEEMSAAEQLRAAAHGDAENPEQAAPATPAAEPQQQAAVPAAPAETPAAEPVVPETVVPEPVAPAPVEAAKPETPAKAVTPQAGGAYVVQLLALRDEGAARAAWKKIAAQHKTILGSHALDIEKADLGAKGVWYRVRAAGFATKQSATSACNGLKTAGQNCIVKKR